MASLSERFWAKVVKTDTCWIWTGAKTPKGYGRFGGNDYAHRLAYELCVGQIPVGLHIDHLCEVKDCVNPEHLEPVTNAENHRRVKDRRTECVNGHPYDEANTYHWRTNRYCRVCQRVWKAARKAPA